MSKFIVLVTGSRDFLNRDIIFNNIFNMQNSINLPLSQIKFIFGDARGVDSIAKKISEEYKLEHEEFEAHFNLYGIKATHIRNDEMLAQNPNLVLAFWDGKSPGTKSVIDKAFKKKINTKVIFDNE